MVHWNPSRVKGVYTRGCDPVWTVRARVGWGGNPCGRSGLAEGVRKLVKEDIPAEGWPSKECQNPNRVRKVSMSRRGKCSCIGWPGITCQSPISERRVSTCGMSCHKVLESQEGEQGVHTDKQAWGIKSQDEKDAWVGRRWQGIWETAYLQRGDQINNYSKEPDFSLFKEGVRNRKREKSRVNLVLLACNWRYQYIFKIEREKWIDIDINIYLCMCVFTYIYT